MTSNVSRKNKQSLITSLPEDVTFDILARVPRCEYPTLSLVSKQLRSLTSPELYLRRSLLGVTEPCFYALFYDSQSHDCRWYIIHRKANGNRCLVLIQSLPTMNLGTSFVAVDSKMYVFGGSDDHTKYRALSIDCRFHTVEHLPSMHVPMCNTIADIIDGRIYVIGAHYHNKSKTVMVVFNTETQLWELGTIKPNIKFRYTGPSRCVAMADKMYINDYYKSYVYEPKKSINGKGKRC
ncbi:F-box/kelch-repeat protein [Raphanus sativus]|nr:F-box/kelch-repeat protein [Raphanus sativus]